MSGVGLEDPADAQGRGPVRANLTGTSPTERCPVFAVSESMSSSPAPSATALPAVMRRITVSSQALRVETRLELAPCDCRNSN